MHQETFYRRDDSDIIGTAIVTVAGIENASSSARPLMSSAVGRNVRLAVWSASMRCLDKLLI